MKTLWDVTREVSRVVVAPYALDGPYRSCVDVATSVAHVMVTLESVGVPDEIPVMLADPVVKDWMEPYAVPAELLAYART